MTKEIKNSIQALVDYLYEDEHEHYQEGDDVAGHIFLDVKRVSDWLDK